MTTAGDVLQFAIPAYALGVTLAKEDYEGSKQWPYSAGTTALAVHGLKLATHNTDCGRRPNWGEAFISFWTY